MTNDEWETLIWRELKPMAYHMADFEAIKNRLSALMLQIQEFRNSLACLSG